MQTKLLPYLFIVFIFCTHIICAQKIQPLLELKASALFQDKATTNYSILVFENGVLKDSIFTKKTKAILIPVESNKVYSIVFKKDNSPKKIVIVNTALPSYITNFDQEPFELQVELSPDNNPQKKEFEDYPIAVLSINTNKRLLMASENYLKLTRN